MFWSEILTRRRFIWLLSVPAGLIVLALVLGFLADRWLESAGGRRAVQNQLGELLNLEVLLEGEFKLDLFPSVAVSGSGLKLVQGDAGTFAGAGAYALSLSLAKLISGEIDIIEIEMTDGYLVLQKKQNDLTREGGESQQQAGALPTVNLLSLINFRIYPESPDGNPDVVPLATINELQVPEFRPGLEVPFTASFSIQALAGLDFSMSARLKVEQQPLGFVVHLQVPELLAFDAGEAIGQVREKGIEKGKGKGQLRWATGTGLEVKQLEWSDDLLGQLRISGHLDDSNKRGRLELQLKPTTQSSADIEASVDLLIEENQLFADINISLLGQPISGNGCLLFTDERSIHLHLEAGELNVDPVLALYPQGETGTANDGNWSAINIDLKADRMLFQQNWAEGVHFQMGEPLECSPGFGTVQPVYPDGPN